MPEIDDGPHPNMDDYPLSLTVQGQDFTITFVSPGTYHYAWNNAPVPGRGFTSALNSPDTAPPKYVYPTRARHEKAVESYLAGIDRDTGL